MSDTITYKYKFNFNDAIEKVFEIEIDAESLTIIREERDNFPEWTQLDNFKCSNCPIESGFIKYCPVAINLVDIIEFFSDIPSYEQAKITVECNDRSYYKETSVQDGVSGLVGILMAASGCPVLGRLKPLVKFHLPFASLEETEYRVFAAYAFAQVVKSKTGGQPDFDMANLKLIYDEVLKTNLNIASKIADIEQMDTSINALIGLNNFADTVTFSLDEDGLKEYVNLLMPMIE